MEVSGCRLSLAPIRCNILLHAQLKEKPMRNVNLLELFQSAVSRTVEMSKLSTDGKWLEKLTADVAPHIREWDISAAYPWAEWPERESRFPNTTNLDVGIDVVAIRRSDGQHIAIQCKSRQLDERGRGDDISARETDRFVTASNDNLWAERWIVTNGDNRLTSPSRQVLSMQPDKPLKVINIHKDLLEQRGHAPIDEDCPHCQPHSDEETPRRTKTCMQNEAVAESVRILREHESADSGGLPIGQARGKIILPCGTGKTRISLRIVEELAQPGELAVVLCPSIALVAQIRREYLQYADSPIRALAVCSDQTAGYSARRDGIVDTFANPTADNSSVSASEVKGKVTTDSQEIADWIGEGRNAQAVNVVFGTYQSGHRVAEALRLSGATAKVLVADEAHRTAGLRRKRSRSEKARKEEQAIRDFTLCHDNEAFPATYRIYQTATPKVFGLKNNPSNEWIVRTMDDETVFGVELYRKSYPEAVHNGWLADYRIIALAVNDPEAYNQANLLALGTELKGRKAITSSQYLRGLAFALAMGGATQGGENGDIPINSCIAFMNSVAKSKEMSAKLQTQPVREWVQEWLRDNSDGQTVKNYTLEHLDATSNVTARDSAKQKLADASEDSPYGIINVGIFGEGTDSPSLNAVAFLESRKSPIDVIQAVGRAMRTAPDKELGYIICPILIPPDADPESWLSTSDMEEGWQELGQILLALRAHDQRIEDDLSKLLYLYVPPEPEIVRSVVAVANEASKRIAYYQHEGAPGEAQEAVERVLAGKSRPSQEFSPIEIVNDSRDDEAYKTIEPTLIITGKALDSSQSPAADANEGENMELRMDTVARQKPASDGTRGPVDIPKTKARAKKMINDGEGLRLEPSSKKRGNRRSREEMDIVRGRQLILLSGLEEHGSAIKMNLLSKSGLSANRVIRDLNILESSISEAAYHLRSDGLTDALNRHFGLDNLRADRKAKQADGCTIAALLMMNAAMLHQRIGAGRWMPGISDLSAIKNDVGVVHKISREWERVMRIDFIPIFDPAIQSIYTIQETGKTSGLERALRHITAEAERIAEAYADMGADHAGPLFNRVIGNQASDGAYFTRPTAASIAARLTLDALGDQDWTNPDVWRRHKTVDLACGSGTLLTAMLTDMKRRAREQGADENLLANLQKVAVEDVIKGMDINPVSLQLAAAQLTAGNKDVRYRKMGLHLMPYGPNQYDPNTVSVGTLELLGQKAIVGSRLMDENESIGSVATWTSPDDVELEDAVDAAKDVPIVIMNPPFTNRAKMGEKFPTDIQQNLRKRLDGLEEKLTNANPELKNFASRNSVAPNFVTLADLCIPESSGMLTMVNPTIALTTPSGLNERLELSRRFYVHTVLTCHQPGAINLSQHTNINESVVVMRRRAEPKPLTRFINLDRMPLDDAQVEDFHRSLAECSVGAIPNGWGEVSHWPSERIEVGDWTPAIWRSPELARAASAYASNDDLQSINQDDIYQAGRRVSEFCQEADASDQDSFPLLHSKGADGQTKIRAIPDRRYRPQDPTNERCLRGVNNLKARVGHLLITDGQDNSTARLTAVASDTKYVGVGWMPVAGFSSEESKALAVFLNSTPGRLQLMRNAGRKITFPMYRPAAYAGIRIPNVKDYYIRQTLADCWELTKNMIVPQFRDGECEVRRLWDEAVAQAMNWDASELSRLRQLLHNEPHVRGLGYGQYADELDTSDNSNSKPPFRVRPNNSGFVEGIDPVRLNQLLDDLDVEEFLAKNPK